MVDWRFDGCWREGGGGSHGLSLLLTLCVHHNLVYRAASPSMSDICAWYQACNGRGVEVSVDLSQECMACCTQPGCVR